MVRGFCYSGFRKMAEAADSTPAICRRQTSLMAYIDIRECKKKRGTGQWRLQTAHFLAVEGQTHSQQLSKRSKAISAYQLTGALVLRITICLNIAGDG